MLDKPWWVVEGTAGIGGTTPLSIPEGVGRVEYILETGTGACVTKIVIANEAWNTWWWGDIYVDTRTLECWVI